jgi:hypothetical protein
MLARQCFSCKNVAKWGKYNGLKRIIATCEQQFRDAKAGEFIFCRVDGSRLFIDGYLERDFKK